ncbi:MAG: hypothetical protein ACJ79H_06430 [Myxococcales bacterium]
MNRLLRLAPLAAVLACGSNPSLIPIGDFSGPTGLAIAPLPDRDLLFVANQGANELRAIILCNSAPGAPTSCPHGEDRQFLPGPVRLFAGSILAGERPLRLAGVRLTDAQNALHGAVLVAGSDPVLRVVDAANIFSASRDKTVQARPAKEVALPEAPIDVVAADVPRDQPASSVTAVVATQAPAGGSAALTVLSVGLGADGLAQAVPARQCAIDFTPARLALIPGGKDDLTAGQPNHVYVADGTMGGTAGGKGDGAVEVSIPDIPACAADGTCSATIPACPVTRRLPASDPADSPRRARPLRSLALSPPFIDSANVRTPGGLFMLAVTAPDEAMCANHHVCDPGLNVPAGSVCVDHGERNCGGGRIVILGNDIAGGRSSVLAAPPVDLPTPPALPFLSSPPMAPLRPPAPAREVAFLGRDVCPSPPPDTNHNPPCTLLQVGVGTSPAFSGRGAPTSRQLIGLASTEDGSTVFIDVLKRRFFDDLRDTDILTFPAKISELFSPQQAAGQPVTTYSPTPNAVDAAGVPIPDKQLAGWMNPGVTRTARLRVAWHVTMPGLESIGGNLSRTGSGPIRLTLPAGKDLTPWISSPELQLGAPSTCTVPYPDCVGDFVRVLSYSATANCADLAVVPFNRDIPIAAVHPDGLELQPVTGFDPNPACFASGDVGGTFEVHIGNTTAGSWLVLEDLDVLGRVPHNVQFVITGPRSGYYFDACAQGSPPVNCYPAPPPADDLALSFSIAGPEPTFASTNFDIHFSDGQSVSLVRDTTNAGALGFAGPILVYDTARFPDQVMFVAITGSNSLLQAIPAQFGGTNGVRLVY